MFKVGDLVRRIKVLSVTGIDSEWIEYDNPSGVGDCSYDSTAQKVVFCYRDANDTYGYGRVGTISGTAITFGTATAIN